MEPAKATSFTIPYNMYQGDRWKFDPRQLENRLRKQSVASLKK
ncbi:MAG TPA: hypothetical protein VLY82_06700 [Nitrososphaerales archaeon]|nr:hypothetical protein [Nitrososphaerales archaeon]